jgi:hypothetical protein
LAREELACFKSHLHVGEHQLLTLKLDKFRSKPARTAKKEVETGAQSIHLSGDGSSREPGIRIVAIGWVE